MRIYNEFYPLLKFSTCMKCKYHGDKTCKRDSGHFPYFGWLSCRGNHANVLNKYKLYDFMDILFNIIENRFLHAIGLLVECLKNKNIGRWGTTSPRLNMLSKELKGHIDRITIKEKSHLLSYMLRKGIKICKKHDIKMSIVKVISYEEYIQQAEQEQYTFKYNPEPRSYRSSGFYSNNSRQH